QAVYDLAKRDDVRAVFDVPWDNVLAAKDALWLQTASDKPMIAGQVTRKTPVSPAKLTILEQTLNPALLHEAGADVIIVHKFYDKDGKLLANTRKMLGNPTYEDDLIALFDVKATEPPALTVIGDESAIKDSQPVYIYAPHTGWLQLSRTAAGDNRDLTLALDGNIIHHWKITPTEYGYGLDIGIPISTTGYHTLTWAVDPPCPAQKDASLVCRQVGLFTVDDAYNIREASFPKPVQYAGLQLLASHFLRFPVALNLDLLWQFDNAVTEQDIRFIKVLDANGKSIATDDHTLGVQPKGGQWVEAVDLGLPANLPAGEYQVYVGWYTYPDLTRFKVLSDVPGAVDSWAQIGSFTIK
ncbi:MAG: hypothetical protein H0X30_34710, partial [Anaerolineae bacterium]|nr:hypothetical protein [Anaerolineae bacterium]